MLLQPSVNDLSEKIYDILNQRTFRNGPLPDKKRKDLVLANITEKVEKNLPVQFLQFWGGSKNINLPIECADLCEEATLKQLSKINEAVKKVYSPGLHFHIIPGDRRVQLANNIPKERTEIYVNSLTAMTEKFGDLFKVTPVSVLYDKKGSLFEENYKRAQKDFGDKIAKTSNISKLQKGAKNNVNTKNNMLEEIPQTDFQAALNYSLVRASEEKTQIFEEFKDYIRAYFVKVIPFYEQISLYFDDIPETQPLLDRALFFYTGRKGNITQPWQAIGKQEGDEVLFLSQKKLETHLL